MPALGVLLANGGDGKTWDVLEMGPAGWVGRVREGVRTRGKRLLELLGLVGVLEDEGVDVPRAADLELDVVDLLVLLDARGWRVCQYNNSFYVVSLQALVASTAKYCVDLRPRFPAKPAASRVRLRLAGPPLHCLRCAAQSFGKRTLGVLAAADLDELLDVGNFGRHFGGRWVVDSRKSQGSLEVPKDLPSKSLWSRLRTHGLQWGGVGLG